MPWQLSQGYPEAGAEMSWMMMVCLPFKWTIEIPVSGTGKCCSAPMSPPP